jgi:hypothetical protein
MLHVRNVFRHGEESTHLQQLSGTERRDSRQSRRRDRMARDHTFEWQILGYMSAHLHERGLRHTGCKSDQRLLTPRQLLNTKSFVDFGIERDLNSNPSVPIHRPGFLVVTLRILSLSKGVSPLCTTKGWTHTSSMFFCMISRPLPAGTSFSNTSSKYLDTCLKVRSIASSFR